MKSLCKFFLYLLIVTVPLAGSGCVWLVVGGAGLLGGYVISPDTVEGVTGHSQEELYEAALKIVGIMGRVETKSKAAGEIAGIISGAKVNVTVIPINTQTARIRVKARKLYLPKIQMAQDVYIKVIESLQE